jgi:hypothetical protein
MKSIIFWDVTPCGLVDIYTYNLVHFFVLKCEQTNLKCCHLSCESGQRLATELDDRGVGVRVPVGT